ncbi:SDR family NAD(P)-dependent oxidoreductase [Patulibacter sp. S7RM1-6]
MKQQDAVVRRLEESGAVVVGGTSGVGLATARRLVEAGVPRLVLMGRDAERGQAACARVRELRPDATVRFVGVDARDPARAVAAVDEAVAAIGSIDVLVNSTASAALPTLLHDTPIEEVAPVLAGLALAPMHMTRAVLPHMRRQHGGSIVNVASDAAKAATPGESVIGAAMAAIVMFTRAVAMEGKRDGIRANAVTPSLIAGTPTGERVLAGGFSAKLFSKAAAMADLGVAEPDDLAGLIAFLAGPGAARLTGQAISVNGGISAA